MSDDISNGQPPKRPFRRDEIVSLLIVIPAGIALFAFYAHIVHLLSVRQILIGLLGLAGVTAWSYISYRTSTRMGTVAPRWPTSELDAFRAAAAISQQHLRSELSKRPVRRGFWLSLLLAGLVFGVMLWLIP